jgi:hypothetical protein
MKKAASHGTMEMIINHAEVIFILRAQTISEELTAAG